MNNNNDDEDLLPPGWIRVESRSKPGKFCYENAELQKRTFKRPRFPPIIERPIVVENGYHPSEDISETTSESSRNNKRQKREIRDDDNPQEEQQPETSRLTLENGKEEEEEEVVVVSHQTIPNSFSPTRQQPIQTINRYFSPSTKNNEKAKIKNTSDRSASQQDSDFDFVQVENPKPEVEADVDEFAFPVEKPVGFFQRISSSSSSSSLNKIDQTKTPSTPIVSTSSSSAAAATVKNHSTMETPSKTSFLSHSKSIENKLHNHDIPATIENGEEEEEGRQQFATTTPVHMMKFETTTTTTGNPLSTLWKNFIQTVSRTKEKLQKDEFSSTKLFSPISNNKPVAEVIDIVTQLPFTQEKEITLSNIVVVADGQPPRFENSTMLTKFDHEQIEKYRKYLIDTCGSRTLENHRLALTEYLNLSLKFDQIEPTAEGGRVKFQLQIVRISPPVFVPIYIISDLTRVLGLVDKPTAIQYAISSSGYNNHVMKHFEGVQFQPVTTDRLVPVNFHFPLHLPGLIKNLKCWCMKTDKNHPPPSKNFTIENDREETLAEGDSPKECLIEFLTRAKSYMIKRQIVHSEEGGEKKKKEYFPTKMDKLIVSKPKDDDDVNIIEYIFASTTNGVVPLVGDVIYQIWLNEETQDTNCIFLSTDIYTFLQEENCLEKISKITFMEKNDGGALPFTPYQHLLHLLLQDDKNEEESTLLSWELFGLGIDQYLRYESVLQKPLIFSQGQLCFLYQLSFIDILSENSKKVLLKAKEMDQHLIENRYTDYLRNDPSLWEDLCGVSCQQVSDLIEQSSKFMFETVFLSGLNDRFHVLNGYYCKVSMMMACEIKNSPQVEIFSFVAGNDPIYGGFIGLFGLIYFPNRCWILHRLDRMDLSECLAVSDQYGMNWYFKNQLIPGVTIRKCNFDFFFFF